MADPGTGAVTTWVPDPATSLIQEKRYADHVDVTNKRKWTYTYTPLGQLKTRTWARDTVTTYNYSTGLTGTGELTSVDYSDSTPDVGYGYLRTGAPYQVTDATGTRTFAYRSDLQLDYEALDTTFYGTGRKVWATYEDGTGGTVYGRPNGHKFSTDSTEENASRFVFDATTGRVSYVRGKAGTYGFNYGYTTGTDWVQTVTSEVANTYQRTNLLLANRSALDSVDTRWNGSVKSLYDTTFNAVGLRSTVAQSGTIPTGGTFTFSYNDRWELTGADFSVGTAKDYTWGYDLMGKRTSAANNGSTTTYTGVTDAAKDVNQYASITGESDLAYDADGNLTRDATWDYAYDAENRLIRMDRRDLLQHLYFVYDYLGRRVRKTVRNSSFAVTGCTKFVWSGWHLSAELDGGLNESGTAVAKTYVWGADLSGGSGAGGLLSVTQNSATFYPAYDVQGNVTGYLNASSGSIDATYEYNAYGQIVASGGSATDFAFGFATQYTDRETGLIYYGYRYYDPKHGRFLNRDPIEESGGNNLYSFVGNNPANGWDMLGMLTDTEIEAAARRYNGEIWWSFIGALRDWSYRGTPPDPEARAHRIVAADAAWADYSGAFDRWSQMNVQIARNVLRSGRVEVRAVDDRGGVYLTGSARDLAWVNAGARAYTALTGNAGLLGTGTLIGDQVTVNLSTGHRPTQIAYRAPAANSGLRAGDVPGGIASDGSVPGFGLGEADVLFGGKPQSTTGIPQPGGATFLMLLNGKGTTSLVHVFTDADGSITWKKYSVFSGTGTHTNNPASIGIANAGPIPTGLYYIVDRPTGGMLGGIRDAFRPEKALWFGLYRDDGAIDDVTSIGGVTRGQFRMHPGTLSVGCVTFTDPAEFTAVRTMLTSSPAGTVPGTTIPFYGSVYVDTDPRP